MAQNKHGSQRFPDNLDNCYFVIKIADKGKPPSENTNISAQNKRTSSGSMSKEDLIYIERQHIVSMMDNDSDDADSVTSDDSGYSVIPQLPPGYPSLMSSARGEGEPYEQRPDIIKTKEVPDILQQQLAFKNKTILEETLDRVRARENLDREIVNEIRNIEIVEKNEQLVNESLKKAACVAKENVIVARKTASDGKTTVKRAMEVIKAAFPVFDTACNKSYEKLSLSDNVMRELNCYEDCQREVMQSSYDFEKRQGQIDKSLQHLENCINLADKDVEHIVEKKVNEESEKRGDQFLAVKREVDDIINGEIDEVDTWMVSCKSDLKIIDKLQHEQSERFSEASKNYEKLQKAYDTKLTVNKNQQEELIKKLNDLRNEERKFREEQTFQEKVQDRAKELHERVNSQMSELQSSITGIQDRAKTSQKVMESMHICGKELLDASIKAEIDYIDRLRKLEIEAKTRQRLALATKAVEKKIRITNAMENVEDYKEREKVLQETLKTAVTRGQRRVAENAKKDVLDFKKERKQEEQAMKEAENVLEDMMKKLTVYDDELERLGQEVDSVDDMYEHRNQDIAVAIDGFSSLSFSENEED